MRYYAVKEMFLTVQGEGANAGRRAVFVRLAGCNLWSGRRPSQRPACAQWCDTDFVGTDGPGGGRYSASDLAFRIRREWNAPGEPFVVWTGGEPTLQWDYALGAACMGFENAIETNGTIDSDLLGMTWITVSPKGAYSVNRRTGNELKLVFPQPDPEADPKRFEGPEYVFDHYFLSPMEPPDHDPEAWRDNMQRAALYVMENPFWRLSVQSHKWVGVP